MSDVNTVMVLAKYLLNILSICLIMSILSFVHNNRERSFVAEFFFHHYFFPLTSIYLLHFKCESNAFLKNGPKAVHVESLYFIYIHICTCINKKFLSRNV